MKSQQGMTGLSHGATACQATLLELRPSQGPQNDPIDMSPGVLGGIWLTPLVDGE